MNLLVPINPCFTFCTATTLWLYKALALTHSSRCDPIDCGSCFLPFNTLVLRCALISLTRLKLIPSPSLLLALGGILSLWFLTRCCYHCSTNCYCRGQLWHTRTYLCAPICCELHFMETFLLPLSTGGLVVKWHISKGKCLAVVYLHPVIYAQWLVNLELLFQSRSLFFQANLLVYQALPRNCFQVISILKCHLVILVCCPVSWMNRHAATVLLKGPWRQDAFGSLKGLLHPKWRWRQL